MASSVVISVASAAPAYSLAATLGLVAAAVGLFSPAIMIVAFLLSGVAAMVLSSIIQPGFFHRRPETAESMTPTPEGVIFND